MPERRNSSARVWAVKRWLTATARPACRPVASTGRVERDGARATLDTNLRRQASAAMMENEENETRHLRRPLNHYLLNIIRSDIHKPIVTNRF
jgi:hypothetical protein